MTTESTDDPLASEILARLNDIDPPLDPEERRQFEQVDRRAVERHIADPDRPRAAYAQLKQRLEDIIRFASVTEDEWEKARPETTGGEAERATRVRNARARRQAYQLLLLLLEEAWE
jgi:hypothetical protein